MELELQHQTLEGYRPVFDSLLAQEETLETIVPDAFPDIARIVSAESTILLKDKEAVEGSVRLTGSANVTVLYIPEGESGPRALEVSIPFQCAQDCPKVRSGCVIHAAAHCPAADARAINPRKLLVRASISIWVTAYGAESLELTCDAGGCQEGCLEKRFIQCKSFTICDVLEKPFLFSDVLRLPASKPAMEELLCTRAQVGMMDAKVIGKKLVFKGDILLSVLYRSSGGVCPARFELPYSQIIDLNASVEDGEPEVSVLLKGLDCHLSDGELDVSVEALAQAALWAQRDVTLMSDVYCTACPLDAERAPCTLCAMAERGGQKETARQFCESGIPAKQVLDCSAIVESVSSQEEGGGITYTAQANVTVLYLSEDDALCCVSYKIPVSCNVVVPEGGSCRCRCRTTGETTAVPVTGGLEVRFDAEFSWTSTREEKVPCVSSVRRGTAAESGSARPSVILRMVGDGESLWEIAKSCGSTIRDICGANGLQGEEVPKGTLLLIPTKRA